MQSRKAKPRPSQGGSTHPVMHDTPKQGASPHNLHTTMICTQSDVITAHQPASQVVKHEGGGSLWPPEKARLELMGPTRTKVIWIELCGKKKNWTGSSENDSWFWLFLATKNIGANYSCKIQYYFHLSEKSKYILISLRKSFFRLVLQEK